MPERADFGMPGSQIWYVAAAAINSRFSFSFRPRERGPPRQTRRNAIPESERAPCAASEGGKPTRRAAPLDNEKICVGSGWFFAG